jgi:hypothetical protein
VAQVPCSLGVLLPLGLGRAGECTILTWRVEQRLRRTFSQAPMTGSQPRDVRWCFVPPDLSVSGSCAFGPNKPGTLARTLVDGIQRIDGIYCGWDPSVQSGGSKSEQVKHCMDLEHFIH